LSHSLSRAIGAVQMVYRFTDDAAYRKDDSAIEVEDVSLVMEGVASNLAAAEYFAAALWHETTGLRRELEAARERIKQLESVCEDIPES